MASAVHKKLCLGQFWGNPCLNPGHMSTHCRGAIIPLTAPLTRIQTPLLYIVYKNFGNGFGVCFMQVNKTKKSFFNLKVVCKIPYTDRKLCFCWLVCCLIGHYAIELWLFYLFNYTLANFISQARDKFILNLRRQVTRISWGAIQMIPKNRIKSTLPLNKVVKITIFSVLQRVPVAPERDSPHCQGGNNIENWQQNSAISLYTRIISSANLWRDRKPFIITDS